ncbi:MAG: 23S rRNA (pseudouridine(1915)-N(3))-methyltransferase RlmH [Chlamydiales bacterium]|nr:23S rRNA (pseudouridine(1915)-N(3))-methyltransferase RlmH [Chlamydiia bacterium]MCP5507303.1 23S rRNA (pseudouridine(1915)-N(3))-methyltransferase RlmH [Chlamydiales bacterium]
MSKIKILTIGKTKESWLDEALAEYCKRLTGTAEIEFILVKNDDQLIKTLEKERHYICLDAQGNLMNSVAFSQFLMRKLEENGARLTLVIGGPEGLPKEIKQGAELISLSPMTLTHQCARLILLEQIYRAFEIAKGSKYHK